MNGRKKGRKQQRKEESNKRRNQGRMNGRKKGRKQQKKESRKNEWKEERKEATKDGRKEQRKKGRKQQRKEGRNKGRKEGSNKGRKEGTKEERKEATKEGRKQQRKKGRKQQRKEESNKRRNQGRMNGKKEGRKQQRKKGRKQQRKEESNKGRKEGSNKGRKQQRKKGRKQQRKKGRNDHVPVSLGFRPPKKLSSPGRILRFTKNFSPNKISVKFLKGEGELHNLELDEKILSDLLELPPWLRISKAMCNKISAKIHWTKLKTDPICLYLDCVEIDMEEVILAQANPSSTTMPPRPPPPQAKEKPTNRYGFVEKVVDGMFVQMNSVVISFKSLEFQASVQISRLIVESTTPQWKPDDLRSTRIKDEGRGEVLTFKDIHWSTLRIDANAVASENSYDKSSAIRLITSQSSMHITIKKKLEDCSVVSARLELLLDDILWVLTQSQLQGLVRFLNSINKAVGQTTPTKEPVAPSTTPGQTPQQTPTQYSSSNLQNGPQQETDPSDFSKHDILETSYHLRTGRIDLHLCDDHDSNDDLAGGAMQVHINKLAVDNYPYHLAGTSRTKWVCHNEASLTRAYWVSQLLNTFRNNIKSKRGPPEGLSPRQTRSKAEGTSISNGPSHPPSSPSRHPPPPSSPALQRNPSPTTPQRITQPQNQRRPVFMYENCYLIRCEEFSVMPVTTNNSPKEGVAFLSSDKKALYLPTDMPAFQVDYTTYYYPVGVLSPVPNPNLFVQLNPVQITLDTTTCIWFNRFLRSIFTSTDSTTCIQPQQPTKPSHVDIRIEALMPKIILPCPSEPGCHYLESRPQALQIQMSQVALTNSRVGSNSSQTELLMLLQQFSSSKLYTEFTAFPNELNDVRPLSNLAWLKDFGVMDDPITIERLLNGLQVDSSGPCCPSQVWCMTVDQFWIDFLGITNNKNRPMPFVEAIPLRLWICTPLVDLAINSKHSNPSSPNLDYEGTMDSRKGSTDSNRIPQSPSAQPSTQPSSAASSPGCQRAHHVKASSFHGFISSPNLKGGPKDEGVHRGSTGMEFGGSPPPVSSSLPASPKLRDNGFAHMSESDGFVNDAIDVTKTTPSETLSLNSSNSLDEVSANGHVQALQENLKSEDCVTLDQKLSENSLNGKLSPMGMFSRLGTETGDVTKAPGSPGHIPNGGSNVSSDDGPNGLRKAFGSYSSAEEENLSDYPGDAFKVANMSLLAMVPANFSVQLDHFQFIFLLRLQEMMVKLQEQLDLERRNHIAATCDKPTAPSPSITFSILAKRGEVNIILPPGPDLALNSRGPSSASSYLDPGFVSDNEIVTPEVDTHEKSLRDTPLRDTLRGTSLRDTPDIITETNVQNKSSRTDLLPVSDVISGPEGRGSALSICESNDGWLPQDGDKNVSKTRRGSDASCGSSQLGTSVDSSARSSARSARSGRVVSVFSAEGNDIHIGMHMEGDNMAVKVTVQEMNIDEKGNMNFEKYLNQKSFKAPRENTTTVPQPLPSTPPMITVRAEFGPGAERNTPSAGERGFAHAQMSNLAFSLMMSNIESLSDCFDDEILLPKMPFYAEMKSSNVSIKDDKPARLLSAPPPLPLNVNLENLSIFRDQDGIINIRAINTPPDLREPVEVVPLQRLVSRQLSRTTSDLSLAESVSSRSDNDSERECLKAQLSVSRAALHAVQDERQALLKTIERLQYELSMSNREQDRLQAKVISYQTAGMRRK
ncbi:hypothetical protein QZH41_018916 [Actinostola sp. cb2023]|nr:hypothetical protein QZH41_018916 [Actinostola sp. cb2023]